MSGPLTMSAQQPKMRLKPDTALAVLCGAVFLTFLAISLPLPVIPIYVHDNLGFGDVLVGSTVSIQFLATVLTRGYAGRLADQRGAKRTMLQGIAAAACAGATYLLAALLPLPAGAKLAVLVLGRLVLGFGESQLMTGMLAWAIAIVGQPRAGKVLAWSGMAMYLSLAAGAPVGLYLFQSFGFTAVSAAVIVTPLAALGLAVGVAGVPPHGGARQPLRHIVRQILRPGLGVATQGVAFATIGAFVSLDFAAHGWSNAGLALTCFGAAFVCMRPLFGHLPDRIGGGPVALVSLVVAGSGQCLLWTAGSMGMALLGAAVTGCGCSMVFPSLGVEVVRRVPPQSRATALGGYAAFQDISYMVTGPVTGLVAGIFGYPSVFIIGALSAFFGVVVVFPLRHVRRKPPVAGG